jgi:hypothetical protein
MERILGVVVTLASIAFIIAANWMPWATSNLGTVRFTPGALSPFMTGIAIMVIALTSGRLRRPAKVVDWLLIGASTTAVITAAYSALHAISSANANPGGGTAYRVGSGVGVLAALLMLALAGVRIAVQANHREDLPAHGAGRTISI